MLYEQDDLDSFADRSGTPADRIDVTLQGHAIDSPSGSPPEESPVMPSPQDDTGSPWYNSIEDASLRRLGRHYCPFI